MKYFLFDRLKYKTEDANKYYKKYYFVQQTQNLLCAIGSSFLALLFTYPFDLAYTRKTAKLVPDGNYQNFKQCFHSHTEYLIYSDASLKKIQEEKKDNQSSFRWKYYEKFPIAVLLSGFSTFFNMIGFSLIRNQLEKDKNKENNQTSLAVGFVKMLGMTSALTMVTSPLIYPFDTLLRQMQVDGGRGYMKKYENSKEGVIYFSKSFTKAEFYR